jgi:hypothetical protein
MRIWVGLSRYEHDGIVKTLADILTKDMREHLAG